MVVSTLFEIEFNQSGKHQPYIFCIKMESHPQTELCKKARSESTADRSGCEMCFHPKYGHRRLNSFLRLKNVSNFPLCLDAVYKLLEFIACGDPTVDTRKSKWRKL